MTFGSVDSCLTPRRFSCSFSRSAPRTTRTRLIAGGRRERRFTAVEGDGEKSEDLRMDEETLAKLRKAEEEAERLRRELASLRASQEKDAVLAKAGRTFWTGPPVDAKDLKRERMFDSDAETGNWLSEADVDFVTGEGREGEQGLSEEDQAIVNRRLVVGGVLSALCVGFAFIPAENFQFFKPSGPLSDYLIPVLRSQDLLKECQPLVENAEWEQVRVVIDRIIHSPNKIQSNLESAVAFLPTAEGRARGHRLTIDILEFIQEMDYNKYFEDRLNRQKFRGGAEEARFVEFSLNALQTAQSRLAKFLSLFSPSDVERARKNIEAVYE